jgi:phosphoglycolate phosphatase/AHBA synthesis associated protein
VNPPPAALLFDLDGVLIDSYEVWFHLLNGAARVWGFPEIDAQLFAETWGQGIEADCERFYPGRSLEEVDAYYHGHFADHVEHLKVMDRVSAVFARLAERGLPSAVITNTPNPLASELVERAGARPDLVVGGTDVARSKPAPDMVLHAAAGLGVPAAAAWVVGDSEFDRQAARAAGCPFVGIGIDGDLRLEAVGELLGHL